MKKVAPKNKSPKKKAPAKPKSRSKSKKNGRRLKRWKELGWFRKIIRFLWVSLLTLWFISLALVILYKWVNPVITPLMVQRFTQQMFQPHRPINFEHESVPIDSISHYMVDCVVASEDGLFLYHKGFDVKQLKISYRENHQGRRMRGGSTISMQTAKNAFLPHRRSMVRKAAEAYYTQLIEWMWGKRRIMEVYLNIIEFGDGIYGVEAASQHYFGHSAKTLTRHEAAQLAVTLPSPLKENPANPTAHFRRRTSSIVARSSKYGKINLDAKPKDLNPKYRDQEDIIDFLKWYREQEKIEKEKEEAKSKKKK